MMSENLLQFIWLHRLYLNQAALRTTENENLLVIHPGRLNTHAGPDFLEAKIKIGETLWVGHIELHVKSSDWIKHRHSENPAYDKLILHVVYEHDTDLNDLHTNTFPTLELKPQINEGLLARFESLMHTNQFIPCEKQIATIGNLYKQQQLARMLAERLEHKTAFVAELLQKTNHNWQELFYIVLGRGFGMQINQEPFEQLTLRTPLSILIKHRHHPLQVEALLFGQAGFLNDYFDHEYPLLLQKEYNYLKSLYKLQPMEKYHWKFLRLRPANFPTLRIAEFTQLIVHSSHLFASILQSSSIREIEKLLSVGVSAFWLEHYHFNDESGFRHKSMGRSFVDGLIINVIVPVMFIYGKMQGETHFMHKAIHLLEELPPESNAIITQWNSLHMPSAHAADTQALLQLKKRYCDTRQCLHCTIGYEILNSGVNRRR